MTRKFTGITHEEYVDSRRREAALIAAQVIGGSMGYVEGVRLVVDALREAGIDYDDPDLESLVCLDSETEGLPAGRMTGLWSDAALRQLAPDLERAERYGQEHFKVHFENIIRRFGPSNQPLNPDPPPSGSASDS